MYHRIDSLYRNLNSQCGMQFNNIILVMKDVGEAKYALMRNSSSTFKNCILGFISKLAVYPSLYAYYLRLLEHPCKYLENVFMTTIHRSGDQLEFSLHIVKKMPRCCVINPLEDSKKWSLPSALAKWCCTDLFYNILKKIGTKRKEKRWLSKL